jgi:hypothetical protein
MGMTYLFDVSTPQMMVSQYSVYYYFYSKLFNKYRGEMPFLLIFSLIACHQACMTRGPGAERLRFTSEDIL